MKIFPSIILFGALLVVGIAASPSEHSQNPDGTVSTDISAAGIRPSVAIATAGTELADPTQLRDAQCYSRGVCDDYSIWMALHAVP